MYIKSFVSLIGIIKFEFPLVRMILRGISISDKKLEVECLRKKGEKPIEKEMIRRYEGGNERR